MKKTLFIAAAALISTSAFAQTVTSANIVGYVKTDTPAEGSFDILSLTAITAEDSVPLQDVVVNVDDLNAATTLDSADQIFVWTGVQYDQYGLFAGASNFWMSAGEGAWNGKGTAIPATASIERGQGVWFRTGTGGSSTNALSSGEVPNDGTYTITIPDGGFGLIAFPYATSADLASLNITDATADTTLEGADQIFVWTGAQYDQYGLFAGDSNFWMNAGEGAWNGKGTPVVATDEVELGKGMWYKTFDGNGKTLGFTQNYNLD